MTKLIRWALVTIALLAFTNRVQAQSATDTSKGAISLNVKDASGAVIPDAEVTAEGPMGKTVARTNDRGDVTFFSLVPGQYKLTVTKDGFSTAGISGVVVQATQRAVVPVSLQAGQITQTVDVSDSATQVDTTSTVVGTNLDSSQIQNIPMGRNLTSVFYVAPGVADSGGVNGPGSANPSISGSSGLENMYVIDGINNTDTGYGGFGVYTLNYGSIGTGVNFDFVKEVQVKTGGYEAQYGQATGGIINVVTNSGGNDIHGAVYAYTTPSWTEPSYNQPNRFRTGSPSTETLSRPQYDYGFNIGGPFKKDKFFWYGSFNPSIQHAYVQAPMGFALRDQGGIDRKRRALSWVGKLNYNITDSHRLEATAFGDPSSSPSTIQGSTLRNDTDSASKWTYGTRNWATKYSGSFGASTLVSASFAWNHTYFTETPETNLYAVRDYSMATPFAAYTLTGGLGSINNPQGDNRQYNAMVTRNVEFFGSHQIDIGYSYNDIGYASGTYYSGENWALPTANGIGADDVGKMVYGGYFLRRPSATIGGVPYTNVYQVYRGNFSSPDISTNSGYQDAFVEDAWRLNRFFTIKAGVRWEQQKLNGTVNKYTMAGNWAPRIGFIADPWGTGKTKIFGSWGYFFEKVPQDLAIRAMSAESGYNNGYLLSLPTNGVATPVPGTTFAGTGVEPTIIYGGTKAQYQEEYTAGVEREVARNLVLRVSYTHRSLLRGLEDTSGITVEQYNAGAPQQYVIQNPNVHSDTFHNPVACESGPNCDPDTGFTFDSSQLGPDGVADGFPDMRRVYNALEISATKRFSKKWSLLMNYRLAKLFGNYEGSFRNDNGQSDPNITSLFDFVNSPLLADQFRVGVLPTDRRHIANLYGNYMVTDRWSVGMGFSTQTGAPLSYLNAHPGYLSQGEIPVGGRGILGRTPVQAYVDLRTSYDMPIGERYKVRLSADMFNVGSRQTVTEIDQNHELSGGNLNSDFQKASVYHRPFRAQFSARFEF